MLCVEEMVVKDEDWRLKAGVERANGDEESRL
jgi:hypothetical protein